jgi:hypothetical protein
MQPEPLAERSLKPPGALPQQVPEVLPEWGAQAAH